MSSRKHAAPLTLRQKKPFRLGKGFWFGPIPAIIAVTLPLTIWAVTYVQSPTARLYYEAQNALSKDERNAYYDKAFNAGHDLEILKEKAMRFLYHGEKEEARHLLTKLTAGNVNDPEVYLELAMLNLDKRGHATETKQLLRKAVAIADKHCKAFPIDTNEESETLFRSACLLMDGSDVAKVAEICKMAPHQYMNDSRINYLKGLVYREQGKEAESIAALGKTKPTSDADWDGKELVRYSDYARAMLALDRSDARGATKVIDELDKNAFHGWLQHMAQAWVEYEKGNYDEALHLTQDLSSDRNVQAEAALNLLRSHIYLKTGKPVDANAELDTYNSQGATGIVFLPKPYRHWIAEARAGQK